MFLNSMADGEALLKSKKSDNRTMSDLLLYIGMS